MSVTTSNLYIKSLVGVEPIVVSSTTTEVFIGLNANINLDAQTSNLTSVGTGENLVYASFGPALQIKSLAGSNYVTVTANGDGQTIDVNANLAAFDALYAMQSITQTSVGQGVNLVYDSVGPDLQLKSLGGSSLIDVVANVDGQTINIVANLTTLNTLYATTLTSAGTGQNIVADSVGPDLQVKSIVGSNYVLVTSNAQSVSIDLNLTTLNTLYSSSLTSVGTGQNIVFDSVGPDVRVKSIAGSNLITVVANVDGQTIDVNANLAAFDALYGATTTTLTSVGPGQNLVADSVGPDLQVKSVVGSNYVLVSSNAQAVSIDLNLTTLNTLYASSLTSVGTGQNIVFDSVGPDVQVKSLAGTSYITVSPNADGQTIDINANLVSFDLLYGEMTANANITSVGQGVNIVYDSVGPDIQLKSIGGSPYVTVATNVDGQTINIDVNLTTLNTLYASSLTSVGTGQNIVFDSVGPDVQVKSIAGSNLITVVANVDGQTIDVNANLAAFDALYGATTTLTSVGTGQNLVADSVGPDLQVKSVAGSNYVIVTSNAQTIDIDLNLTTLNTLYSSSLTSVGTGQNIVFDSVGPDVQVKSIAGSNLITVVANVDGQTIDINANLAAFDALYGATTTLTSVGTGQNLVADSVGPDLQIKSVAGSNYVIVTSNAQTIDIDLNLTTLNTLYTSSLTSVGTGQNIVFDSVGPDVQVKSIAGSNLITVVANVDGQTIDVNANLAAFDALYNITTLTSVGPGQNLVADSVGPDLQVKSVVGSSYVVVTSNIQTINLDLNVTALNTLYSTSLTSVGTGQNIVFDSVGPTVQVKSIAGSNLITVVANVDGQTIDVNANLAAFDALYGATTTLTSAGTGQNTVIDSVGPTLQVKSLAGSNYVTVSPNGDGQTIDFDLNLASLNTVYAVTVNSVGAGQSLVYDGAGPDIALKSIAGSTYVTINANVDTQTLYVNANVASLDSRYNASITSVGLGQNLVYVANGPAMETKSIRGIAPYITVTTNVDGQTIDVNANITALDALYATNLLSYGGGMSLVADSIGPSLGVVSLANGSYIDLNLNANLITISGNTVQLQNLIDNSIENVHLVSVGNGISLVYGDLSSNANINGGVGGGFDVTLTPSADIIPNSFTLIVDGQGPSLTLMNIFVQPGGMTDYVAGGALILSVFGDTAFQDTDLTTGVSLSLTPNTAWWIAGGFSGGGTSGPQAYMDWVNGSAAPSLFTSTFSQAGHFFNTLAVSQPDLHSVFYIPASIAANLTSSHYIQWMMAGGDTDLTAANSRVYDVQTTQMTLGGQDLIPLSSGDFACPIYFNTRRFVTYMFFGVRHNLPGNIGVADDNGVDFATPADYGGVPGLFQGGLHLYIQPFTSLPV